MTDTWNEILTVAKEHSGYFTTKQIEEAGISRTCLKNFVENSSLIRIGHGKYSLSDVVIDDYALLQKRSHVLLFSHGTALYLWEMSDRIPHVIDVTVPAGTNVSRIKKDNPEIRFHYIRPEMFKLGMTQTNTPMGSVVKLYDKERCICDIIRAKKDTDMQLYTQAIKDYFQHSPNMRKLLKYSKQFGIEDKIRTYSEVLI